VAAVTGQAKTEDLVEQYRLGKVKPEAEKVQAEAEKVKAEAELNKVQPTQEALLNSLKGQDKTNLSPLVNSQGLLYSQEDTEQSTPTLNLSQ